MSAPPTLDSTLPATPAHEWADQTASALGADKEPTPSTTAIPSVIPPPTTPGLDLPGAYPLDNPSIYDRPSTMQRTNSHGAKESVHAAASAYVAPERLDQVENLVEGVGAKAAQYVPTGVSSLVSSYWCKWKLRIHQRRSQSQNGQSNGNGKYKNGSATLQKKGGGGYYWEPWTALGWLIVGAVWLFLGDGSKQSQPTASEKATPPITTTTNTTAPAPSVDNEKSGQTVAEQAQAAAQTGKAKAAELAAAGAATAGGLGALASAKLFGKGDVNQASYPSTELAGAQPGTGEQPGVGSLPGPASETGVAKLPEERSASEATPVPASTDASRPGYAESAQAGMGKAAEVVGGAAAAAVAGVGAAIWGSKEGDKTKELVAEQPMESVGSGEVPGAPIASGGNGIAGKEKDAAGGILGTGVGAGLLSSLSSSVTGAGAPATTEDESLAKEAPAPVQVDKVEGGPEPYPEVGSGAAGAATGAAVAGAADGTVAGGIEPTPNFDAAPSTGATTTGASGIEPTPAPVTAATPAAGYDAAPTTEEPFTSQNAQSTTALAETTPANGGALTGTTTGTEVKAAGTEPEAEESEQHKAEAGAGVVGLGAGVAAYAAEQEKDKGKSKEVDENKDLVKDTPKETGASAPAPAAADASTPAPAPSTPAPAPTAATTPPATERTNSGYHPSALHPMDAKYEGSSAPVTPAKTGDTERSVSPTVSPTTSPHASVRDKHRSGTHERTDSTASISSGKKKVGFFKKVRGEANVIVGKIEHKQEKIDKGKRMLHGED